MTGVEEPENWRLGPGGRTDLRAEHKEQDKDKDIYSMLIFVRGKTAKTMPAAVKQAIDSAEFIDYDYSDPSRIPMRGNTAASELIKEMDKLIVLAKRVMGCFELKWPLDVKDPDICWLSNALVKHFGTGWCGGPGGLPGDGGKFQRNSRRALVERIIAMSKQWQKARVSSACSSPYIRMRVLRYVVILFADESPS